MNRTATPRDRTLSISRRTVADSRTPSAAVGSSRTRTRAPKWTRPPDRQRLPLAARERADKLVAVGDPADAEIPQALQGDPRRFVEIEPPEEAAPFLRLGGQHEIARDAHQRQRRRPPDRRWRCRARAHRAGWRSGPARRRPGLLAVVGVSTPVRILMMVDLPAPFSPSRQKTSPGTKRAARGRRPR